MTDAIAEFTDDLAAAGYRPMKGQAIVADDKWHRLIFNDERTSSGRYRLMVMADGFAIGSYGSDKDSGGFHRWHSKGVATLSPEQRAEAKRLAAEAKMMRLQEMNRLQERVANRLAAAYKSLAPAKGKKHDYLIAKGIGTHGVRYRVKRGELIVPILDTSGRLWNVQRINSNGKWKAFFKGARVLGGCFPIGKVVDADGVLIICEGFATGASIHEATGLPVRVAFNTSNLKPVAQALHQKYPQARIIFCADNDRWVFRPGKVPANLKPGGIAGDDPRWEEWRQADMLWNPGIEKAQQAALAIGGAVVIWPEFGEDRQKRSDFNDMALRDGHAAVNDKIRSALEVRRPEPEVEEYHTSDYGGGMAPGDPSEGYEQPGHAASTTEQKMPFKILGHNDGQYYFFPMSSGQIFSSTAPGLASIANLFRLAPLEYWDSYFNSTGKLSSRKVAEFAANALIAQAHEIGVFRPKNIRGVGAWMDAGKSVIHCGDHLYVGGENVMPHQFKSKFVYPLRESTFPIGAEPMRNHEASKLRELCGKISWESKLSGELLAGWIVIAPFCGALEWRPHIWIEGESESGKSTVINRIIRQLLDDVSLRFEGGTTEAAIRQTMGVDVLPVIYDEAEPENIKDRLIMDGLLLLARRASSGGNIAKGGANGQADNYMMRSCFCFAGINPAIKQRADESRISRLILRKATFDGADQFYKDLKKELKATFTKEFSRSLIARTVDNLPTLIANSEVFTDAAAAVLTSRRAADQIGPMLAGLYLLTSTKRVEYDQAVDWIKKHDWTSHTAIAEQSDPERLITHICTSTVRYRGGDTSVGNLIKRALGSQHSFDYNGDPYDEEASRFLRDMGIWVRDDGVLFANKSPPLDRLLRETAWISWARPLQDIEGAEKMEALKFATGLSSRSVKVPLKAFGL